MAASVGVSVHRSVWGGEGALGTAIHLNRKRSTIIGCINRTSTHALTYVCVRAHSDTRMCTPRNVRAEVERGTKRRCALLRYLVSTTQHQGRHRLTERRGRRRHLFFCVHARVCMCVCVSTLAKISPLRIEAPFRSTVTRGDSERDRGEYTRTRAREERVG